MATALAFLLSADVPGVNVALSPELLNDAAPCKAFWIAQEVAYQSEETADLLGVNQTVIGPQEYRHYIN